jgi:large subunit ribosomal protein L25
MSEVKLTATSGRTTGTRPSRRLRAEGRVPGVVYGGGDAASTVEFDWPELRAALSTDAGTNALVRIELDGSSFLTIIREIQRHPVRRDITHVDFLKIDETAKIEMDVPIVLVGEAKEVQVNDGMVEQKLQFLQVLVRPADIPNEIEIDISDMQIDDALHVSDLQLPSGVEVISDADETVVTADLTRAALVPEDEEEGAEGEGGDAEAEGGDEAEATEE